MEISLFHQFPNESLSEALDRFHRLLKKTPTHGYNEPVQLNIFIGGLRPQSKQLLDASAGGKIKLKTSEEAMELIENVAASDHAILRDRTYAPTKRSLLELTTQDATLAQNKLLSRQIEALTETFNKLPQQLQAETRSHMKRTDAAIKNLEVQIGQLTELVAEKPTETFAVNAEMKPKEDCKVIFTKREEKEKKTEEDVRDEGGEKNEERERNEEKAQQWEKYSQVEIQQESIL
ncbi:hypothetical protein GmHk_01G002195 [Glycine max]|nr:hypothetical protein GmHk_01G002195 [Glycine max]